MLRGDISGSDPARAGQRRADLQRLAAGAKPVLLFVAHAWGGGVRHHMADLAELVGERCETLLLEPVVGDVTKLSWLRTGEDFSGYFTLPADFDVLVSLLRHVGVARIHFHHVRSLPRFVLDLPSAIGVPFDCTLHDYYAICPQYHLVTQDGRYCGEPDEAGCAICLHQRPAQWGLDIAAWRGVFERLLRAAERVIAPSRDVARRMSRYFPELNVLVVPHPEKPAGAPLDYVRVATLGSLAPEKGLHVVTACAGEARARNLPLSFRILGSTTEPVPQWPEAAVSVHGEYERRDLPALLSAEKPDVIWFPAQVPETYSYTLSVALASGIPIVATDLGALAERLADNPSAALVPWTASATQWNDALLRAGQTSRRRTVEIAPAAANSMTDAA